MTTGTYPDGSSQVSQIVGCERRQNPKDYLSTYLPYLPCYREATYQEMKKTKSEKGKNVQEVKWELQVVSY